MGVKNTISIFIMCIFSTLLISQNAVNKLDSKADFKKLCGSPLVEKYGQVAAIKIVYDIKSKKIFYINSKYFKYHHDFCSKVLSADVVDLAYFNKINYSSNPERRYLLANINHYKSTNVYALEISPIDLMNYEDIILFFKAISKTSYIGDKLKILLNSPRLQELSTSLLNHASVLYPSDIYTNLKYQAVGKYKGCGTLHYINHLEVEKNKISPMDIVVLKETPLVLPKVSGIIISEFQTPLSHISILGQNRKIPIAALKSVFEDTSILKLNNQKICLNVLSDTFKITLVDVLPSSKPNKKSIKLNVNLNVKSLVDVANLDNRSFSYAGHKANNFGKLYRLSKISEFKVPECAFVIPFYFYHQHIKNSEANQLIEDLLARKIYSEDSLVFILKNIRKAINNAPIDSALLVSINIKIKTNKSFTRFRFRSSTNAEDAQGFSGAGLYSSKTGILHDESKSFEKAIKSVWASLWSFEAHSERNIFNINHKDVYMGVLVHRSFPDEDVNGVAITKNLYRQGYKGFIVNAQIGDENVVKPEHGIICDQFICYPNSINNTIDIITQSNLNAGKLVMTEKEIQHLANQLELIKRNYFRIDYNSQEYLDAGLDVEFKLEGKERNLYIKQMRPYND
jgi:pyruvate, water dikinase